MFGEDAPAPNSARIAPRGKPGVWEQFKAGFEVQRENDNSFSIGENIAEAYEQRAQKVQSLTGVDLAEEYRSSRPFPYEPRQTVDRLGLRETYGDFVKWQDERLTALLSERPDVADQIETREQIITRIGDEARARETREIEMLDSDGSGLANFGGRVAGAFTDPINLATLPLGGPSKTIAGAAAKTAAINAGVEAAIQPFVQGSRVEIGLEGGLSQGALNVAAAGVGGGILGGGGKALEQGGRRALAALRGPAPDATALKRALSPDPDVANIGQTRADALEAYDAGAPSPEGDVARTQLEADIRADAVNPYGSDDLPLHREALAAVERGDPLPELPSPSRPPEILPLQDAVSPRPAQSGPPVGIVSFAADELQIDAKRFQFKADGDADGVTERLKDVTEWDPVKAGTLLVRGDKPSGGRIDADGDSLGRGVGDDADTGPDSAAYGIPKDGVSPDTIAPTAIVKEALDLYDNPQIADLTRGIEQLEAQLDALDAARPVEAPIGVKVDGDDIVPDVRSSDDIELDLDADQSALDRLRGCVT